MVRFPLLLLALVLLVHPARAQDSAVGALRGQIVETGTETPLPGANVVIENTTHGAAADRDGRFHIDGLPAGTYILRVSMIGYGTVMQTGIEIRPRRTSQVTVRLSPGVVEAEGITVTPDYFFTRSISSVSTRSFRTEEIYRAPGATQDIQRVVQAMPGLSFYDDQRNDLIVRGGSPAENLTLLNGIEVPNINHFGTQGATGGPISMVDSDFIEAIEFSTGGFGAEYGGRLSSVLDIQLREGEQDRTAAALDLSMAGAGGSLEGPIDVLGTNGSWFVGVRRSYLDLLVAALDEPGIPQYGSAHASATVDLSPSDRLTATGLFGAHAIHIEQDLESDDIDADRDIRDDGHTALGGLTWRHLWGSSGHTALTVSGVRNTFSTDVLDADGALFHRNRSRETTWASHLRSSWSLTETSLLEAGASARLIDFDHDLYDAAREDVLGQPIPERTLQLNEQPLRTSAYAELQQRLPGGLTLTGGLRHEYVSLLDHGHTLSPRLSARLRLSSALSLTGAWGIYRQVPSWTWFSSTDATRTFRPMRADHAVAGIEWRPAPAWMATLEGYHKDYRQVPVPIEQPMLSTINQGAEFRPQSVGELADDGTARAYGVEAFVQRRLTGRFYGTFSYALSWSRYTPVDGIERPTDFDQRHVSTLIVGARPKPLHWIGPVGGSIQLRYASGAPATPFDLEQSRDIGTGVIDYEQVNSQRLPDYVRLDLRIDRQHSFAWGSITGYVEVQNTLGRENAASRLYNRITEEVETHQHWGRFFVGGFRVEL